MQIRFRDRTFDLEAGESVLEGLLRAGEKISNSCRSGACQSCLLRCLEGELPKASQAGLRPRARAAGLFLSCQCRPQGSLSIADASDALAGASRFQLELVERDFLAPSIFRLRFKATGMPAFLGGQFIALEKPDGLARSYSIASLANEDLIELHVRQIPDGRMSGFLADELNIGETLQAEGPRGDCTYEAGKLDQGLFLVGVGTGMAPLWAVLRSALAVGHRGPINVLQAGLTPDRLYLLEELRELAARHDNLTSSTVVKEDPKSLAAEDCVVGDLFELLRKLAPEPRGQRIFLCGDPNLVNQLRREFFLSGAALDDILGDPFAPAVET
ncbi:MAG: 2Fe-2S iron-sulfur cluster binding domain-containing protein [Planctomycetota bacterium]